MNKYKSTMKHWLYAFIFPRPFVGIFYLFRYIKHYRVYKQASSKECVELIDSYPCLLDSTVSTPFDGHYFYQGAWLARRIKQANVDLHVDVGSSVMMISVLSALVKTVFVDYRPLDVNISGLSSVGANITKLPFMDNSIASISCQHVIEHIGLGRYGDPIDTEGSFKAAKELERVVRPGGVLYLSLPVGRERVCFNAHRVHDPCSVVDVFSQMSLVEFSFVDDAGKYFELCTPVEAKENEYGCGMYMFKKQDGQKNKI